MGYVGTAPVSGDYRKLDDISSGFNGVETAFALQVGSVNVTPPKATAVLISVGGILQEPVTAYGISVSTITFTAAPAAGSDFFGIMLGNQPVDIGSPGDDTVTTAKILDNAVTLAKMAGGTAGNLTSFDASGDPVAVSTGTTGQLLTSAGAGAPPTFAAAGGGGLEYVTQYRLNADTAAGALTANWEVPDTAGYGTLGTAVGESSGIFTFPKTGYWLIEFTAVAGDAPDNNQNGVTPKIYTTVDNASNWVKAAETPHYEWYYPQRHGMSTSFLFDATSISGATTCQVKLVADVIHSSWSIMGNTAHNETHVTFTHLGDT